jgi:hypothetical protein
MLYSEIITVCSQIHTKHINTLYWQNVQFLNVESGGMYSNHWVLKGFVKQIALPAVKSIQVLYCSSKVLMNFANKIRCKMQFIFNKGKR